MLGKMNLRKNGKPATAADLTASRRNSVAELEKLTRERLEIEERLPQTLLDDPAAAAADMARLGQIEIERPPLEKALALIDAAIVDAEKREDLADIQARRDTQDRASERLAKGLKRRYDAALAEFIAVLTDINDDARACAQIGREASEAGLTGLWNAEYRARKDEPIASAGGFSSVTNVELLAWDGSRAWPR